jgi:hypothetical protein
MVRRRVLGKQLRRLREQAGLTLEEAAPKLDRPGGCRRGDARTPDDGDEADRRRLRVRPQLRHLTVRQWVHDRPAAGDRTGSDHWWNGQDRPSDGP